MVMYDSYYEMVDVKKPRPSAAFPGIERAVCLKLAVLAETLRVTPCAA
jgi:hypothetical protein